jgi:colanic acid/amylovoran biosynthesis glycosyltransferase
MWDGGQSTRPEDRDQYRGFGEYLRRLADMPRHVTHAHSIDTAWRFLPAMTSGSGPLAVAAYGFDLTALPRLDRKWEDRYREVVTAADAFVVQGRAGVPRIEKLGVARTRIYVMPLGIPASSLAISERVPVGSVRRFVQIAHYREKKGHLFTLMAFEKAFGNRPDVHLTFVGDTPRSRDTGIRRALLERVSCAALENVTFKPAIRYRDLGAELSRHDFYVQPSVETADGDVEGGPLAILEAQARGLPVLATMHENIPDLVLNEESGFLVPERDVTALAAAMLRAVSLSSFAYTAMSRSALANASNHRAEVAAMALYDLHLRLANA